MDGRKIIGLTEKVVIHCSGSVRKTVTAKIDTGADNCSIDKDLAKELGLGPVKGYKKIKQASGEGRRPYVKHKITLAGKTHDALITIADRSILRYNMLIGKDILKKGYLIDPVKR